MAFSISATLATSLGQAVYEGPESRRSFYASQETVAWWLLNVHIPFLIRTTVFAYRNPPRTRTDVNAILRFADDTALYAGDFLTERPENDRICSDAYNEAYRISFVPLMLGFQPICTLSGFLRRPPVHTTASFYEGFFGLLRSEQYEFSILGKEFMSAPQFADYSHGFDKNAELLVRLTRTVAETASEYDKVSIDAPVLSGFCEPFGIIGLNPDPTLPSTEWRRALFFWRYLVKEVLFYGALNDDPSIQSNLAKAVQSSPSQCAEIVDNMMHNATPDQREIWDRLAPVFHPPLEADVPVEHLIFDAPFAPGFTPKRAVAYGRWLADTLIYAGALYGIPKRELADMALQAALGANMVEDVEFEL